MNMYAFACFCYRLVVKFISTTGKVSSLIFIFSFNMTTKVALHTKLRIVNARPSQMAWMV
jgi:hypothetical protein